MTIAELLQGSRAAHLRYRHSAGKIDHTGAVTHLPDDPAAQAAVREALGLREQAHLLDPQRTDPAWAIDQAENRGQSSDTMADFFRNYLS